MSKGITGRIVSLAKSTCNVFGCEIKLILKINVSVIARLCQFSKIFWKSSFERLFNVISTASLLFSALLNRRDKEFPPKAIQKKHFFDDEEVKKSDWVRALTAGNFSQMSLEYGLEKSDDSPCRAPVSRLRVEKIEGGLVVAGVVVAANCQVALPVFGCLFILVGIVLTVASYRGPGQDEAPENYAARLAFTGNSRILGPSCIVVGFVMLSAGIALCFLTRKARRKEKRVGFHCPIHGDFYPLSPVIASKTLVSHKYKAGWSLCFGGAQDPGVDGICRTPPQCPHTQLSSTRSSFSSMPISPCPTPMPFLVASTSVSSDLANSMGVNVSPDQTFGSIRSLSVSREVASFPLSRTPSPPLPEKSCSGAGFVTEKNTSVVRDENHIAETDENCSDNFNCGKSSAEARESDRSASQSPKLAPVTTEVLLAASQVKSENVEEDKKTDELWLPPLGKSARKSVSIVLPNEENG